MDRPTRIVVANPPAVPLMLFDGECGFCRRWVARWRAVTAGAVHYETFQEAAARFPEIPPDQLTRRVHLVEPDGRVTGGAGAALRAFEVARRHRAAAWAYRHVPGFAPAAEAVYRWVAEHRAGLDKLDTWALGKGPELPSYFLVRGLFLRALGVIYLIAFWSLAGQVRGLVGSRGILPIADYLDAVRHVVPGAYRYAALPTLCWWNASDAFLFGQCAAGIVAALALTLGLLPLLTCTASFALYLSLTVAGQDFLGFQWDGLLLEAGFLAIFWSPWQWHLSTARPSRPSTAVRWLIRWLAFRVMFLSGVLKWTSGDVNWRHAKAMSFHYQTQPLPGPTSWFAHWEPTWLSAASGVGVFVVEALVPLLYFLPRKPRVFGFWATVAFQCLIMATGNFGFFNLLTIVLCIPLLDDAMFPARWYERVRGFVGTHAARRRRWPGVVTGLLALAVVTLSVPDVIEAMWPTSQPSPSLLRARQWAQTYHVVNPYGLFRVMTVRRPEVVLEASADGTTWAEYAFRYKPGDVTRRPPWCVPHMPRLDWQMWFAALQAEGGSLPQWIEGLTQGLLDAEPSVLGLLDRSPLGGRGRPRYVRAVLYQYEFTAPAERQATGAWWRRQRVGVLYTAGGPQRKPDT